jgi:hypothetical protein
MTKEAGDMILPMLREMRREMQEGFATVTQRLEKLAEGQKSFRNALSADSLMSKFVIGDFEGRLAALERRFDDFTKAK